MHDTAHQLSNRVVSFWRSMNPEHERNVTSCRALPQHYFYVSELVHCGPASLGLRISALWADVQLNMFTKMCVGSSADVRFCVLVPVSCVQTDARWITSLNLVMHGADDMQLGCRTAHMSSASVATFGEGLRPYRVKLVKAVQALAWALREATLHRCSCQTPISVQEHCPKRKRNIV